MKKHSARFLAVVDDAKSRIQEMTVAELLSSLQGENPPIVVDVREDHEFAKSAILGALHLGKGILERDAETTWPDLDTPLVLYCGGGYRSALAADALQTMGYRKIWSLAGGFRAWKASSGAVETPE